MVEEVVIDAKTVMSTSFPRETEANDDTWSFTESVEEYIADIS